MPFAMARQVLGLCKEVVDAWIDDYAPSMGAALSYYTLFSIAPLVLIVIALGLYPNFVVHRTEQATTGAITEAHAAGTAQEVSAIP